MNGKILSLMMTILITTAAFAGGTGDDDPLDESDGGYTYASNVDEHRKVVEDVCEIKEAPEAHDWDEVNEHYTAPSHSSKVLHDFASATGKKHGYAPYYTSTDTPMDDFVSAAIGGTGMFSGESSSVREQAVEKGVQNWIMVAYAVHELNAAMMGTSMTILAPLMLGMRDGPFTTDLTNTVIVRHMPLATREPPISEPQLPMEQLMQMQLF